MRLKVILTSALVLLLSTNALWSQSAKDRGVATTRGSRDDQHLSVSLRGKQAGFILPKDGVLSALTAGAQVTLKGRHSLGLDLCFLGWLHKRYDANNAPLYIIYERSTYLYLDYNYRFARIRRMDFYINGYSKLGGVYHQWQEGIANGYTFWEKPSLRDNTYGTYQELGAGIGLRQYFTPRFFFDANANVGKRFSKNDFSTYDAGQNSMVDQNNVKTNKGIFYIRLNLGYKLYIKKA